MSDLNEIKNLLEKQAKAHADFENTVREDIKKPSEEIERLRAENSQAFEKMDKQLEDYDQLKEKVDELAAERERSNLAGGDIELRNEEAVKQFMNYARTGHVNATALEVRSDPDGGYTVPQITAEKIIKSSEGNNPMAMLADRVTINTGNSLDVLADPDELGYSESGEGSVASGSTTPEVFKTNIPLKKIDSEPKATIELLQDSAWNIEAWLEQKAARIFRKRLNTQFTTGAGVDQCRGLMTYTAVANATFEASLTDYWGSSVGYVASGNASTIPDADCLVGLTDAVQDIYLPNAAFMMSRSTLTDVRQLKATTTTAGDKLYSLWSPSLVPGQPDTLMGYPVYKNDAMASVAANALSIAFGDISEAYTIVDKANGMYMVRDPYTSKAYVKFYFARRVGGGIVNFEAIKYLKVAAS